MKKSTNPSESQALLFRLLENNTNAMFIIDNKWNFLYINKNAQKFSNTNVKTLIGKNLLKELPEFKKTIFFKHYKEALNKQKEIHFEEYYQPLNKWLSVHVYPSKEGLLVYYTDSTEKRKLEEELSFQLNILEHVSNSIIVTDLKGDIIFWNKGAENLFGYTFEDVKGKSISLLYEKETASEFTKQIKTVGKGSDYIGEWKGLRKDGKTIWINIRTTRFYNGKNEAIGYIGIANDITPQKNVQENLSFLAQASKVLSSSLNFHQTLQSVSDLAVSTLADWCSIDLLQEDGKVELIAVSHKEPSKVKWARKFRKDNPPKMDAPTGLPKVLKTGTMEYYPLITDEFLEAAAKDEKELKLLKDIGFRSIIIAPIFLNNRPVAAITFVSSTYKRLYTQDDVRMAEELAARASLAIENARLYQLAEQERERLNNLLSNVPGVVWESYGKPDSATQRINFVSEYVESMLGYTVDEWLSTPNFWLSIVHPEDKEKAAKEANKKFIKGKAGANRFRWITKKGKVLWVESNSTSIKDKKGEPIGMRGVTMDITHRVELEQKKDEFIGIASHELKTPLTSVKGYLQILERRMQKSQDEKARLLVEKSNIYIDRLNNLISDLLDVSKIQAGKLQFNISTFDLYDVIKQSVETISSHMTTHEIIIEHNIHQKLQGDMERLEQVVTNLLTNAIKYSPNSKKVYVNVEKKNSFMQIGVRDEGIGISQVHQKNLFQRFYRVEQSEKMFTGLGIGLYISSQIVRRHGGDIWVESEEGKGSTFIFSLPIKATSK